jgi:hypothetical protein
VMSIGKFVDELMIVSKSLCVLPRLRLIIAIVAPIKYLVKLIRLLRLECRP